MCSFCIVPKVYHQINLNKVNLTKKAMSSFWLKILKGLNVLLWFREWESLWVTLNYREAELLKITTCYVFIYHIITYVLLHNNGLCFFTTKILFDIFIEIEISYFSVTLLLKYFGFSKNLYFELNRLFKNKCNFRHLHC